jgi:outer membrane immunogenic protein
MKTPGEDDMRISRFFFGAAIAFSAGVVSASAADLPARMSTKDPMAAPVAAYNWTGCYIGGNAGGGTSHSNFTTLVTAGPPGANHLNPERRDNVNATAPGPADDAAFIGGGQVGCNWQTGSIVFGLEGDFDYFGTNPSLTRNGVASFTPFTITNSVKTSWLATVRPRVGLALDRSLLYLTGGLAITNLHYTQSFEDLASSHGIGSSSASKTQFGWTVGGGWEYALTNSWSVKGEYLYAQFSSVGAVGSIATVNRGPFLNGLQGTADLKTHIVRVGANYHFNNPVVARY